MEFSCMTVYDYPAIKALQYAVMYKNGNPTLRVLLRTILCGIMAILFGGAIVFLLSTGAVDEIRPIWFGLALVFCTLFAVSLYCHIGLPRAVYKANSRNGEANVTYTFRAAEFRVDALANGVSSVSTVDYTSLYGAYETKEFYLLFLMKNNANIVSRAALSPEQDKALREWLKAALGKQYKVCKF